MVIVEESTPGTQVGICPCWFDSHLTWGSPAHARGPRKPDVPGPPYKYHARLKAYWNSPTETGALLAKAQTVSLAPFAVGGRVKRAHWGAGQNGPVMLLSL